MSIHRYHPVHLVTPLGSNLRYTAAEGAKIYGPGGSPPVVFASQHDTIVQQKDHRIHQMKALLKEIVEHGLNAFNKQAAIELIEEEH